MAVATSTFSPRPASRAGFIKPLQAAAELHILLSFPRAPRPGRRLWRRSRRRPRKWSRPPRPPTVPPSRPRPPRRLPLLRPCRGSATPEARRRKWLEDYPEATDTDEAVVLDTSVIPWWAWMKRFHLPEAEKLNGRAALIGFFMAYFVDSLTSVGLVDQMGNFFCESLLFVVVAGVLLIRKNEDLDSRRLLMKPRSTTSNGRQRG